MKRILSFVLAAAIVTVLFAAVPTTAVEREYATVETGKLNIVVDGGLAKNEVKAGETAQVKISLVNNPGISSILIRLSWSSKLTLTNLTYDIVDPADTQVMINTPKNYSEVGTSFKLNWMTADSVITGDCTYATLTFTVSDTAEDFEFLPITGTIDDADDIFVNDGDDCVNVPYKFIAGGIDVKHEHVFGELTTVTPATCTEDGVAEHSCSCGYKENVAIPALGHQAGEAVEHDDHEHWHLCTRCGAKVNCEAHVYDDNTDNTCNVCGFVRTLKGDTNYDGKINNKDIVTLFRYISTDGTGADPFVFDFNEDEKINNKDVVALFRYVSSL